MQRYVIYRPGARGTAHQRGSPPAVWAQNLLSIACLGNIERWCGQHTASVSLLEADRLNLTHDIPAELRQCVTHGACNGAGIARYVSL